MSNQLTQTQKRRWLLIVAITLVVVVFAATMTALALASGPNTPPPMETPSLAYPPTPTITPTPPKAQLSDLMPRPRPTDQPRIDEITIAGKVVKLPDDAKSAGLVLELLPVIFPDGGCGGCEAALDNLPLAILDRGNSRIWIGINTGKVVDAIVAPGEEAAFDFISDAFPDQAQVIESFSAATEESDEVSQ